MIALPFSFSYPTLFFSSLIAVSLPFSPQLVYCMPSSSLPCFPLFLLSSFLCYSSRAPEVNTSKHWPAAQTTQMYWSCLVGGVMGLLVLMRVMTCRSRLYCPGPFSWGRLGKTEYWANNSQSVLNQWDCLRASRDAGVWLQNLFQNRVNDIIHATVSTGCGNRVFFLDSL